MASEPRLRATFRLTGAETKDLARQVIEEFEGPVTALLLGKPLRVCKEEWGWPEGEPDLAEFPIDKADLESIVKTAVLGIKSRITHSDAEFTVEPWLHLSEPTCVLWDNRGKESVQIWPFPGGM